jgi:hypothetical protein
MIKSTATRILVSVDGPVVYLDSWALIDLAERNASLRLRLVGVHAELSLDDRWLRNH